MNAYRIVIGATLFLAVVMGLSFLILSDADTTVLFSILLIAEAAADVIATLYVLALVLGDSRRPRSWLLLFLLTSSLLITAGLLPIAFLVILRLTGQPPLANGLGLRITGTGLILVGAVPIMKGMLFALVQREKPTGVRRRRATDVVAEPPL